MLLHQHNTTRALSQFKDHLKLLRKLPGREPPLAVQCAHLGWIARQYAVMADLLSKRSAPEGGLPTEVSGIKFSRTSSCNWRVEWCLLHAIHSCPDDQLV